MFNLMSRDQAIMRDLGLNAPLMSEEQILAAYWPLTASGRKNGQRRLRLLCRQSVIDRRVVHAKATNRVALLCESGPAKPPPSFEELARESRARWQSDIRPVAVYVASRRTRVALGAPSIQLREPLHAISHSLGVTAVYLHLKRTAPQLASLWVGEDHFSPGGFHEAQPDAFLCDTRGVKILAIEFAGDYPAERFMRLHHTLCEQGIDYLIYGAER